MADARLKTRLLLSLARRAGTGPSLVGIGLSLLSGVAAVSTGLWLKLILDAVVADEAGKVVAAGAALGAFLSIQAAGGGLSAMVLSELHMRCGLLMVQDIMRASGSAVGVEHHERPDFIDQVVLMRSELNRLSGFLPTVGEAAGLMGRIGATAVLLASIHPILLLLAVLAVPSLWAAGRAEAVVNRATEATAQESRLDTHLFTLATTAAPAKELRIFGLGPELVRRQHLAWDRVSEAVAGAQLRAGLLRTAGWLPFAAGYLGAVAFVVVRAGQAGASAGDVLLVLTVAGQVNGQVSQAVTVVSRSAGALRVLGRFLWLQDYVRATEQNSTSEPVAVPDHLTDGIHLHDVSFNYPGSEASEGFEGSAGKAVLESVTLHLPAGSTVALVGENGAGKTTLVKLLCRFYQPTSGRISVDGVDLDRFDAEEWRQRLSGGFQDFVRFELLLRESVGVGDLRHVEDRERVRTALARVSADLPIGLEDQLGQEWDEGVDLSAGQWQTVAMARAMMRERPLLVVLDEPTSGLDAHAEHALFELFAETASNVARRRGAVALLVSHRFSTVRMADHIVVLAHGRIVEQGTHDDLVAGGGLYSELYGLQADAYR